MYALISPDEQARYISSWTTTAPYIPTYTTVGERVAQVAITDFPVAPPLFWTACADNVVADQFYYNPNNQTIASIPPNAPMPTA